MLHIRPAHSRGHAQHGWLDSRHTFSFADYFDPQHMGFRNLRVINEDRVQPGMGFGTHPHRDMDIISYVLEGALTHKDSMGNGSTIRPGDVQRMSAGTGVLHSEFNASREEPVHFLQIWLVPEKKGVAPEYAQKSFTTPEGSGLTLLASAEGEAGSLPLHSNTRLYKAMLQPQQQVEHRLQPGRHAWIQVVRGRVEVNGQQLSQGDGAAISQLAAVQLQGLEPAELLLFDLG